MTEKQTHPFPSAGRGQVEYLDTSSKTFPKSKKLSLCGPHKYRRTSTLRQIAAVCLVAAAGCCPSQLSNTGPAQTAQWPRSEAALQGG